MDPRPVDPNGPAMRVLAEAYAWLEHHGLISVNQQGSPYKWFVTRLGYQVFDDSLSLLDAIERLDAIEHLSRDLHPRVAHVRSQFLLGQYEIVAWAALRAVEVRGRGAAATSSGQAALRAPRVRVRRVP